MTKITQLPQDTSPTTDDLTITVDSTSGQAKKLLLSDLITLIYANYPATAWTSYTPTITNLTQGTGTLASKYIQIGKTVIYQGRFTFSGTSSVGGVLTISLPVTAVSSTYATREPLGIGMIFDSNVSETYQTNVIFASTTTLKLNVLTTRSGTNPVYNDSSVSRDVTTGVPIGYATGDIITWQAIYEVA